MGGTVQQAGNPDSWLDMCQIYLNTVNHMVIAVVSIYTTWLCVQQGFRNDGWPAWNWHTWLCTIGYQFLMCEAIMSLYQQNSWTVLHTKRTKTNLHWILQAIGSTMAIAGMVVYFVHRNQHFVSIHSKLGLASGVFTCIGILNGTSALWAKELIGCVKPVYSKLFHNIIGIGAFTTGMSSLIYGLNKFPIRQLTSADGIIALQVLCGITIILSLFGAAKSLWRLIQGAFPGFFYKEDDEDDFDVQPRIETKGTV